MWPPSDQSFCSLQSPLTRGTRQVLRQQVVSVHSIPARTGLTQVSTLVEEVLSFNPRPTSLLSAIDQDHLDPVGFMHSARSCSQASTSACLQRRSLPSRKYGGPSPRSSMFSSVRVDTLR